MGEVKLTKEGIRYIALFENLTGATVRDCIVDDANNRIIFVVKNGDMGLAIGRRGDHINRVKKSIGKHIEIVEYSDNIYEFIKNAIQPASIKNINIVKKNNKLLAYVEVLAKDKGIAIGKSGKNITKAKNLVQRHYDIDDLIVH
ncbi:MAG TPA: NusA-like transcription termination signal-binding factor [Methanosarcinales archaeon]|nr:NusA-like transcription termination signal-binding factor [Methanosarcinales archaeon]